MNLFIFAFLSKIEAKTWGFLKIPERHHHRKHFKDWKKYQKLKFLKNLRINIFFKKIPFVPSIECMLIELLILINNDINALLDAFKGSMSQVVNQFNCI